MISYYKYDTGNAFTLSGSDYTGYFHIQDGVGYTNKSQTDASVALTPKDTFISDAFLNEFEFDNSIVDIAASSVYSLEILEPSTVTRVLDNAHLNNVKVFKNLIRVNPSLATFNPKTSHFYGLSSTKVDARDDDEIYGKNVYTHIDPFAFDDDWEFLDRVISGVILPKDDDTFIYICATPTTQYVLEGHFTDPSPLILASTQDLGGAGYYYADEIRNELFLVSKDKIQIFDLNNFTTCGTFNTIDVIDVDIPEQYLQLARIGNNVRLEVSDIAITLKEKYSNVTIQEISFETLGISGIDAIDIRFSDNNIILAVGAEIVYFDIEDINNSITKTMLDDVESITQLDFSDEDSNVFYIKTGLKIQSRFISNPAQIAGDSDGKGFLYLRDYIYDTTIEKYDEIQIKYNSNALLSNSFNNVVYDIRQTGGTQYYMIHNIGRLYVSKSLPSDSFYKTSIDIGLGKSYSGVSCISNSIGQSLNTVLANIIQDTLTIYTMARSAIDVDGDPISLSDLKFESKNLQFHGNETVSVVTLQRIFALIADIQTQILKGS